MFTGGGGAGSEALHRLLRGRYEPHFADADRRARPHGVPSEAWHQVPLPSSPDFLPELIRLCAGLGVDALIPGVDEELLAIARSRDSVAPDVVLPPLTFVETHLDKLQSNATLERLGVAVPETESMPERRRVRPPCIVKPRRGRGSRDVAVVRTAEELRAHVLLTRRPDEEFIVQERLVGQEYTVTMVADRVARLRAIVPVKVGLKRGITLRAETDNDPAVMAACAAIHAAQPVSGCFNIQLVKTASGAIMPFEINPRISTTMCLAVAAGIDFVALYLDAAVAPPAGLAAFERGMALRRSWHNEFLAGGEGAAG